MRAVFFILISLFSLALNAQTSPPIVNRSSPSVQQVDPFLIAARRLGIPTSATDDTTATSITAANTVKLLYNTSLEKLRVYDPVAQTWKDAVPVSGGGGGENFANTDLTLDANRVHALDTFSMVIREPGVHSLQLGADVPTGMIPVPDLKFSGFTGSNAEDGLMTLNGSLKGFPGNADVYMPTRILLSGSPLTGNGEFMTDALTITSYSAMQHVNTFQSPLKNISFDKIFSEGEYWGYNSVSEEIAWYLGREGIFQHSAAYANKGKHVITTDGAHKIPDKISNVIVDPNGTISGLTIQLPDMPIEGQHIYIQGGGFITSGNVATGFVLDGNGNTIIGNVSSVLKCGIGVIAKFDNGYWYVREAVSPEELDSLTASLATVATTGDYNDLINKPTVPTSTSQLSNDSGFITSSALTPYTPLLDYYGAVSHTSDTVETVVITQAVAPAQWFSTGMYAATVIGRKTGVGTGFFKIYLNTTPTIGGALIYSFETTQNDHTVMRRFAVNGTELLRFAGPATAVNDVGNGSAANQGRATVTVDRSVTLYFVVTLQGSATGVTSTVNAVNVSKL